MRLRSIRLRHFRAHADTSLTLAGTSDIIIESQGTSNHPAGVFFGSHYAPLPFTAAEVRRAALGPALRLRE